MTKDQLHKDFFEKLKERDSRIRGYYKSVLIDRFEGGYPIEWDNEIMDFYDINIQDLLQELFGKIKKEACSCGELGCPENARDSGISIALNKIKELEHYYENI